MKIPKITSWTPEIEGQFCEEFWGLSEKHKARKYTLALSRKIIDILGSMWWEDDYGLAVQLFMRLKNNDKRAFSNLLAQNENKEISALIRCIQKRAKNLFLPKGLPWTGHYYRFRRPDRVAKKFLSTQEEVQLYHELLG
jgi:hypothetical protein